MADSPEALAEQVAAVVANHPAVAALDAGPHGAVAMYLPGRRLAGVRIGAPGEAVEIGVVLRLGAPIPDVVRALRAAVSAVCAGARVDIGVMDVEIGGPEMINPIMIDHEVPG